MQLRYVFSELGQGLRRNLSMQIAVVLTLFVSLTLVGLGVLLNQQTTLIEKHFGSQVQITVKLCRDGDPNPRCTGEVTDEQKRAISRTIKENPEAVDHYYESKEQGLEKIKEMYPEQDFSGKDALLTAEDVPQTLWIELADPQQYEGIVSAIKGLDGVSQVDDTHEYLEPLYDILQKSQWSALGTAALLVVAALLLVANTIRLAAYARRKEIGIMRLVGASTLYIALPFLLEALVAAVIGVLLAAGALAAVVGFGIQGDLAGDFTWLPWIGLEDYLVATAFIAVLGPVLTVVPTLVLTRKYLKV